MNTPVVAVFGASGATGQALLEQFAQKGVAVHALVRKAGHPDAHGQVIWQVGSLLEPDDVFRTLLGCDAAVCVFGPRPPYVDVFCEQATTNIVAAMRKLGIRRLVCQTGGMIGDYRVNRTLPFQWMTSAFDRQAPRIAADRAGQEHVVKQSGLNWTIVKPPRLTDGAATGKWVAGTGVRLGMLSSLSRSDLAAFLAEEALRPAHLSEAVFVRN